MTGVTLQNAIKRYGQTQVIHGIDLEIEDGEFCVFVGPSGCGKSTLLRMIAGLEETTEGSISIGTRDVTRLDPAKRGVAMVFQTYALYPHMTVAENMGFGLRMNGVPKAEIEEKVQTASDILKLGDYLKRKPKALSGGQRQRVAIGRAIVRGPEVFLFDEPLSNLDAELRVEMRVEISRLHSEIGATMIYVTHDQVEAMTMADKIVVLRDGRVEQVGAPLELYRNPDNRFVAGFIGSPSMNFLDCKINDGHLVHPVLSSPLKAPIEIPSHLSTVTMGIRPEHIELNAQEDTLQVELTEALGGVSYSHLIAPNGEKLIVEERGDIRSTEGDSVGMTVPSERVYLFDPQSGLRLR